MNTSRMESQLLTIARDFLRELEAERAVQAISLDASLERDLGIDSLGKVELFHRIEKQFSVRLPEVPWLRQNLYVI
ncbi:MAG: acyl carrier protein [Gammaproteobacteria bacterium]